MTFEPAPQRRKVGSIVRAPAVPIAREASIISMSPEVTSRAASGRRPPPSEWAVGVMTPTQSPR